MKKAITILPLLFSMNAFSSITAPHDMLFGNTVDFELKGTFTGTAVPCRITEAPTADKLEIIPFTNPSAPSDANTALLTVEAIPGYTPQISASAIAGDAGAFDGLATAKEFFEIRTGSNIDPITGYSVLDTTPQNMQGTSVKSSAGYDEYSNRVGFKALGAFSTDRFELDTVVDLSTTLTISCPVKNPA